MLSIALLICTQGNQERDPVPIPVPNAFDTYIEAVGQVGGGTSLAQTQPLYLGGKVTPAVQKEVERLSASLASVRKGLKMAYREPVVAFHLPPGPYAGAFNMLGRSMLASGDVKSSKGDIAGAYADYTNLFRLGAQFTDGGEGVVPLIGVSLQDAARGSLWAMRKELTLDQLAETTSLVGHEAGAQRSLANLLALEEYRSLQRWKLFYKSQNYALSLYRILRIDPLSPPPTLLPGMIRGADKQNVVRTCKTWFDAWIERAQTKSFPDRGSALVYEDTVIFKDPLNKYLSEQNVLSPALNDGFWYALDRNKAANGAAAIAFATAFYARKNGRMPKAFTDFGPGLLFHLPDDPFALGKGLTTTFSADEAVIASVGPWGKAGSDKGPARDLRADRHGDYRAEPDKPGPLEWRISFTEVNAATER